MEDRIWSCSPQHVGCSYTYCILACLYAGMLVFLYTSILVYLYACMLVYLYACMLVFLYACMLVCLYAYMLTSTCQGCLYTSCTLVCWYACMLVCSPEHVKDACILLLDRLPFHQFQVCLVDLVLKEPEDVAC